MPWELWGFPYLKFVISFELNDRSDVDQTGLFNISKWDCSLIAEGDPETMKSTCNTIEVQGK